VADIDQVVKVDDAPALAAIRAINDAHHAYTENANRRQAEIITSSFDVLLAMFAAVAATIVVLLYLTYRALSRQLGGEPAVATGLARAVAQGDLTVRIDLKQGDSSSMLAQLRAMQDSLVDVVANVRSNADGVATASAQVAQGNLDLSQRTEEQATTLEETASQMEELTATVAQNADNARQASQLAVDASDVARKGGQVVGQVVSTMTDISNASRKIADIIGVIDGIAFQTNILALNAAVEAARAGEQGRGFAVVASEVRSLAQRSAAAAKEIKALIGDSADKVEAGTRLVDAAGQTMEEIVASVRKVSDLVADIAAASQEQSAGIGQINTAVTQMDQVVQQNAALVEEATAATASMKEQAAVLLRMVSRFQIGPEHAAGAEWHELKPLAPPAATIAPIRVKDQAAPEVAFAAAALASQKTRAADADGEWKTF
jgi:methyl-accepting chemotaxis protein